MEIKPLASGNYSRGNFMYFRRRQNENDMLRRLFQSFQKRVKSAFAQHMDFVDYIDFIFSDRWREIYFFYYIPHLVNLRMRRRVNFHHIQKIVLIYAQTNLALIARIALFLVFAIHGLGENSGDRSFPDSSRPGKKIRVSDLPAFNGIPDRPDDMLLPHHLIKTNRPVFSI